ncbi:DUF7529 family protein [Salinilacihabitans rarus]|uniref:DUF7529 family protein n=1 Tax=Salinilacihabitans rarus TaxID=2961596 RepID=UPI0020C8FE94|nr:hypothetical protein [Salinilacihabitans rarus]
MTDIGPDDAPDERTDSRGPGELGSPAIKTAWQQTLEDMRALEAQREEEGWEVVSLVAGDTAPTTPSTSRDDSFGLVFVVPGSDAEAFAEAFERGTFPRYEVYRNTADRHVFLVVEYLDPEEELAVLVAGAYSLERAEDMAKIAQREEEMYTHVRKLDGTVVGSFRHEKYAKFVPDAGEFSR